MPSLITIIVIISVMVMVMKVEGQGVRTSLDFGWKFQLLNTSTVCNTPDPFPDKLIDQECFGLSPQAMATSAEECEAACCTNPGCYIFQWCNSSECAPINSCWTGASTDCETGHPGWVSGRSNETNPTPSVSECTSPECTVSFDDSQWRSLNVPHDFVVEGTFTPFADRGHGYLPVGRAWYRLHFSLPSNVVKGQSSIWITFDGVYRNSITYLNGVPLGNHPSGYTSFIYDLTTSNATLNYGGADNVLAVYVDSTQFEGWWYEGGGIYRHVWLTVADGLHIEPWGVFAPSTVTGQIFNVGDGQFSTEALVYIQTDIINSRTTFEEFEVINSVITPEGKVLGVANSTFGISPNIYITVTQTIVVENVNLWSADSPYLYNVTSAIVIGGQVIDSVVTTIGIRKVLFDVDLGLFINDNPVKINGVCNHQDFAGVGTAVPDRINLFRVQKLKEMGVNGWRMSHNPPNPELLDFTDRVGMYVMDENRNFANSTQYYNDAHLMVVRDRNHPSVIMWSVCNEAGCMENDPAGAEVGAAFKSIIKAADPFRPVVAAMNLDWGIGLSNVLDAQGINYAYGEYVTYHESHPYQPIFGSETASCTGARSIYVTNNTAGQLAIYNADSCAQTWVNAVQNSPWVAGGFSWTGFDYKGEPTPYNWPDINSNFGTIDIAGYPKDTFYYYQSWYTNQTVLHLFPHWNWQQGDNVSVWVYTNAPYVQLFVNNMPQGVQAVPRLGRAGWIVPFVPGAIAAVSYDINNNTLAVQNITTTGVPYSISLSVDTDSTIRADGQDVALVTVTLRDSWGSLVPTASNYISFEITNGIILGVGNGDPASHEPDKANGRSAFGGLARVIVQSLPGQPGPITMVAVSVGLVAAKLVITAV